VVGAGLPSLPAQLAEATSYAERLYDYRPVGLLADADARDALILPVRQRGVEWDDDALAAATGASHGYPYFLQSVGKHVWDNARTSPIAVDDVEVGLAAARQEVDDGLYRSRWERATPAQRDLLRALAHIAGDQSATVRRRPAYAQATHVGPVRRPQRADQERPAVRPRARATRVHRPGHARLHRPPGVTG